MLLQPPWIRIRTWCHEGGIQKLGYWNTKKKTRIPSEKAQKKRPNKFIDCSWGAFAGISHKDRDEIRGVSHQRTFPLGKLISKHPS